MLQSNTKGEMKKLWKLRSSRTLSLVARGSTSSSSGNNTKGLSTNLRALSSSTSTSASASASSIQEGEKLREASKKTLPSGEAHYYSLQDASKHLGVDLTNTLPRSMKVLAENMVRFGSVDGARAIAEWVKNKGKSQAQIDFRPARVLMQDFTGVPAVVDLAAMRDALAKSGLDAKNVNPQVPVDLVIDHSVSVDSFGKADSLQKNTKLEFERNKERYEFLKWGQSSFENFSVVPPGRGICHQINLEFLCKIVWTSNAAASGASSKDSLPLAYPDTLVGTDSHTTMVNGLSVLGWGTGGIEAEAAMLGQPISMVIPDVIGVRMVNDLPEGATATDLVLTTTEALRKKGVVGKFVEFFGPGLDNLTVADRATLGNMSPEFGSTCGFFPTDHQAIEYMRLTNRGEKQMKLIREYAEAQGMWRNPGEEGVKQDEAQCYTDVMELDLAQVKPCVAGPKRPQDRVVLTDVPANYESVFGSKANSTSGSNYSPAADQSADVEDMQDGAVGVGATDSGFHPLTPTPETMNIEDMKDGAVAIAAITSCTNTSNPAVMIGAGIVARKARQRGLKVPNWVKTSLAPGSQVVTDYLVNAGLQEDLDALGFTLAGYGCTTCIGNSGELPEEVAKKAEKDNLTLSAVLSGNRNFEGRINQLIKANYLASPPLCVAYGLAGNIHIDLTKDALGKDGKTGEPVYLKDIWPTKQEIQETITKTVHGDLFEKAYDPKVLLAGTEEWQAITGVETSMTYPWKSDSTYVKNPPFFENLDLKNLDNAKQQPVKQARVLALLGDSVTTDHISPAGAIKPDSPAGEYLKSYGVARKDFNSYGARRGNYEIMTRGTFANIRINNQLLKLSGMEYKEGGYTTLFQEKGEKVVKPIYDAAMEYKQQNKPLVVIAGKEYGTGSSRDWAAKGTTLLGIRAVLAESFERIHRSNLVGMSVLPLQFPEGKNYKDLNLGDGDVYIDIDGIENVAVGSMATVTVTSAKTGEQLAKLDMHVRIDTEVELGYFLNGGILHKVLKDMAKEASAEAK